MLFEFPEDEKYFRHYLCDIGETLERYESLFDLRPPAIKRAEFNSRRTLLLKSIREKYKDRCQLHFEGICDEQSGWVVDHLIPLSSNVLNKSIRHMSAALGKKVLTQSFGSNHPNNLILSCTKCNSCKKHNFLPREHIKRILQKKHI
jgi:5-methylcytosine-specific restriction endonuclease McrA